MVKAVWWRRRRSGQRILAEGWSREVGTASQLLGTKKREYELLHFENLCHCVQARHWLRLLWLNFLAEVWSL